MIEPLQFAALKASGRLPLPSDLALELIRRLEREDVSLPEICRLIQRDPALVGRLLRLVNSSLYARPRPAAAITPDVLMMLGLPAVRSLVLAFSLIDAYRGGASQRFDYLRFWQHSLAEACAAQHIGLQLRVAPVSEMFTLGLITDIGQLALASWARERYDGLLEAVGADPDPTHLMAAERKEFGFDHLELSAALAGEWGLPQMFQQAMRWHTHPENAWPFEADNRTGRLIGTLSLAHRLAATFAYTDEARGRAATRLTESAAKMGIFNWMALADMVLKDWQEWGDLFALEVPRLSSFSELLAHEVHQGAGLRVLIVEDDAVTRRLIESLLEKEGYEVRSVADGASGLRIAREWMPEILITDILMPGMDGIGLIRHLREETSGGLIYVLVVTVLGSNDHLVEAFAAGADDYVVKPIDARVLMARLKAGCRVIRLQQTLIERNLELQDALRKMEESAMTDALTGLRNRRYALERLTQECAAADRADRPLSVLMLDIDHFKAVNDRYGHDAGDAVLIETGHRLLTTVRTSDIVARFGGEEFLVIAPNTDRSEALKLAERLRRSMAERPVSFGHDALAVTISIGVVERNAVACQNIDQLIKAADDALYAAKHAGRNCVRPG